MPLVDHRSSTMARGSEAMQFVVNLAIATLLMSVALTQSDGGAQTVPPSHVNQNASTTTSGDGSPPPHRQGATWREMEGRAADRQLQGPACQARDEAAA